MNHNTPKPGVGERLLLGVFFVLVIRYDARQIPQARTIPFRCDHSAHVTAFGSGVWLSLLLFASSRYACAAQLTLPT